MAGLRGEKKELEAAARSQSAHLAHAQTAIHKHAQDREEAEGTIAALRAQVDDLLSAHNSHPPNSLDAVQTSALTEQIAALTDQVHSRDPNPKYCCN